MRRPVLVLASIILVSGCSIPVGQGMNPTVAAANGSIEHPSVPWHFLDVEQRPETVRSLTVGDPDAARFDGTVGVYIWNAGPTTRTLNVTLSFGRDNETLYRRTVRLPANRTLMFQLGQSGRYAVSVESATNSGTMVLTSADFDCNERAYVLWANRTGAINDESLMTSMACGPFAG